MELRHLRYFVAVAELLHFGRAARRLQIAQPSLSHQIRQLESELQTRLLERTRRQVELTDAGRLFLEEARQVLAAADHAALVARRGANRDTPRIRVAAGYCMDHSLIINAIRQFNRRHANVRVEVQTMAAQQQLAAFVDNRLDIGFIRSASVKPPLVATKLISEPLVVALPRQHRLAKSQRAVQLDALSREIFVLVSRDTVPVFHELVLRVCRDAGFVPDAQHEVDHLQLLLRLVAAGAGISLVPEFAKRSRMSGVAFRTLAPTPARHQLLETAIAHRSDASRAVVEFVEIAHGLASARARIESSR